MNENNFVRLHTSSEISMENAIKMAKDVIENPKLNWIIFSVSSKDIENAGNIGDIDAEAMVGGCNHFPTLSLFEFTALSQSMANQLMKISKSFQDEIAKRGQVKK